MQFDFQSRRLRAVTLGVAVVAAATVSLAAAFPTIAEGAGIAVTSVTCSVTGFNWCISGNNTSSGIGVIGTSKSGTGLRGTSTSQYGLKATSVSGTAILAQTTSGSNAVTATDASTEGFGVNASGGVVGLYGTASKNGYGVYGTTKSGSGDGVLGTVTGSGTGVSGNSSKGTGGDFNSASDGDGVDASAHGGIAVYAFNTNGNGADVEGTNIGVIGRAPAAGYPLVLTDSSSNVVFEVDGKGNVSYSGGLSGLAKTARGGTARSFSPNSTQPTVEDSGTAQLVRGVAIVRLDPTFAASIEPTAAYRVFVTPDGDTHGLFVAGKTAGGFVVRESQAGRSTVTFDYRILATSLGAAGQHMSMLTPAAVHALAPRTPSRPVPAVALPAVRPPTPALEPATP